MTDYEKELLETLKSIDGTLKRIEQDFKTKKQIESEYISQAVQSATHDIFQ
jgi:hypothetical protein